jgi:Na+/H+ antiporter NhaD/arsenite permease-like protein
MIISLIIFIIGYSIIALENNVKLNKSAVALITGVTIWIVASLAHLKNFEQQLETAGSDIFSIIIFLLISMALVEVLIHYRFFDIIRGKLYILKVKDNVQFLIITFIVFWLSAILNNLTVTIVGIQIARKFFKGQNLLLTAVGIVIASNSGGAFSPIGDITTLMLWLANKFTAMEVIIKAFIPSIIMHIVSILLICKGITKESEDEENEIITKLDSSEIIIIVLALISFILPVIVNLFHLPPYLGLLIGLGIVWIVKDFLKQVTPCQTHLDADIDKMLRNTDIASLVFFTGILLAVAGLYSLGVLEQVSKYLFGQTPSAERIILGATGLGLLSAIVDNVPLTAIAIKMLSTTDSSLWSLLAFTVGNGGSLLVIGSASGIVAMGMLPELTFARYAKIALVPGLIAYFVAILAWCLQYFMFHI